MLKNIIQYVDLDNDLNLLFDEIKKTENFTDIELQIGPAIAPEQCANDIEKILDHFAANKLPSLEISFSNYHLNYYCKNNPAKLIVSAFANKLKENRYPKGLVIDFTDIAFNHDCIISLANTLQVNPCHYPFTIKIKSAAPKVIDAFSTAFMSGNCPQGLHLDINAKIYYNEMLNLVEALGHKNCPKDLSLSINPNKEINTLCNAIQHGRIPQGLSMKWYGDGNEYAECFGSTLEHLSCTVENLKIELMNVDNNQAALIQKGLEAGLNKNLLPHGLDIFLNYTPPLSLSPFIKFNIDKLLGKNAAKHAALACTTLSQGNRYRESILFTLPNEMINCIQSHVFSSNVLPFFKHHSSEKKQEEEKSFLKNVTKFNKK